ncbi:groucho [Acrasis kona]|uniref:Groucho n=1 Tax=Acrasis kona TaxID=1008807 RepID=A0AAW2Z6X8_9EUKA
MTSQFSAPDMLDRLKQEFEVQRSQIMIAKTETERIKSELNEQVQLGKKYYDAAYFQNIKIHKLLEVNGRLLKILDDTIPLLPQESQDMLRREVDLAKKVSVTDIKKRIKILHAKNSGDQINTADAELYIDDEAKNASSPLVDGKRTRSNGDQMRVEDDANEPNTSNDDGDEVMDLNGKNGSADKLNNENLPEDKRVPKSLKKRAVLTHDQSVSSISFSAAGDYMTTGGKGVVKMWDTTQEALDSITNPSTPTDSILKTEIECVKGAYIRTCKLSSDDKYMVVCGETKEVVVVDLTQQVPRIKLTLQQEDVDFHYALTLSLDGKYCYSCFSDGMIGMWDLNNGDLVRRLIGHEDSVSCVDLTPDGTKLISGSLDKTMKIWDAHEGRPIETYQMQSRIFTLGACPTAPSWIAVGLENSYVEVVNTEPSNSKNYQLHLHENCVLSLKFAPGGSWFVTGGKDKYINTWKAPYGPGTFRTKESNSILSCDVSPDGKYVVTGSWEKMATIYDVEF